MYVSTVSEAIAHLESIRDKHGPDTPFRIDKHGYSHAAEISVAKTGKADKTKFVSRCGNIVAIVS